MVGVLIEQGSPGGEHHQEAGPTDENIIYPIQLEHRRGIATRPELNLYIDSVDFMYIYNNGGRIVGYHAKKILVHGGMHISPEVLVDNRVSSRGQNEELRYSHDGKSMSFYKKRQIPCISMTIELYVLSFLQCTMASSPLHPTTRPTLEGSLLSRSNPLSAPRFEGYTHSVPAGLLVTTQKILKFVESNRNSRRRLAHKKMTFHCWQTP